MNDIISAALNAATLAGASYADVRVVDTSREAIQVASGVVEAVERSDSFGFGVRAIADGAWGFASSREVTADAAVRVARRGGRHRSRVGARRRAAPVVLAPGRACARHVVVDRARSTRSPSRSKTSSRCSSPPTRPCAPSPRSRITKAHLGFFRERKWFGSTEGALTEQSVRRVRRRHRRLRHRRRRGRLALLPQLARRRLVAGRLGVHRSASTSSATPRASPSRPPRCSRRRTCEPARATSSSTAASWRCRCTSPSATPPSSTASSARRRRSRARRSCGSTTSARCGTAREHRHRDGDATVPGSLGSFGWDDEGVPAQRDYLVRDGVLAGLPELARDRAASIGRASNGCMRADGWNRIPLVRMTTVSLEPGTWDFDDLIADTERRPLHRDQQLLVDRRQAPQLPVRHRDRLGDRERQARPHGQEPQLHRHHAAVLELVRRDLLARALAGVGAGQLRQGRADAGRSRRARRRARPLPRRAGRGGTLSADDARAGPRARPRSRRDDRRRRRPRCSSPPSPAR